MVTDDAARENIKKWLAALRSGKYKQGLGVLRRNDEFCCLGVACEVFQDYVTSFQYVNGSERRFYYKDKKDGRTEEAFLPNVICQLLKMRSNKGELINPIRFKGIMYDSLIVLNDMEKVNFNEIADFIEENWDQIFLVSKPHVDPSLFRWKNGD